MADFFEQTKGLLTSKTFWGLVLLIAARFIPDLKVTSDEMAKAFDLLFSAIGAFLAIYGRIVASKKIKGLF